MTSIYDDQPIDLDPIQTYPLASRPSKVTTAQFARAYQPGASVRSFLDSLPDILAARDLRAIAQAVVKAREHSKPVIVGLGGHVIKCGLAPVLIDLMQRGVVTALAMTGAGVIHDFEIALAGATSEDVDAVLPSGRFGMAEETGRLLNEAIIAGANDGIGLGEAIGRALHHLEPPYKHASVFHAAYAKRTPMTVHITIGADIIHLHPAARGEAIGATSHHDFRLFCSLVRGMDGGGVYLNLGSAVTLPEVFLKAVTVVRNLGTPLENITTANFDFLQHYRPLTNVVRRPVADVGRGYAITGHHEIMIPLLAACIIESL
ncbi:MAG: deoxyhypusine synthase family protein [Blastocatellia bacterium]|nr:deoxyhypusine synthase family protein [Blastocatellia bacterium]